MTKNGISSCEGNEVEERMGGYKKEKAGLRCHICTGCGLCPGVMAAAKSGQAGAKGLRVLAGSMGFPAGVEEGSFLRGEKGERLVTADVGTTTIAMLLYGRDGSVADRHVAVNPQIEFGADVISRIQAAEKAEWARKMRGQVEEVLERGIRKFRRRIGQEESLRMVLAANTTMTYLLLGWDCEELGRAPFRAGHLAAVNTEIAGTPCFIFPGVSAFVGGDIAAGIYACGMEDKDSLTLLVDLGTNGEMVLGNRYRRIACATAAGPAFEGGANRGVWGADMVGILSRLRREEILDETGLLSEEFFESGIRVGNVLVTQKSVRAVQMAKAAIAAGIDILLKRYGVRAEQVDRVVLAGGFGYYLKPEEAAEIGLLPKKLAHKAVPGGDTALAGALRAGYELIRGEGENLLEKLENITAGTEALNLAMEAVFEERYLDGMKLKKIE